MTMTRFNMGGKDASLVARLSSTDIITIDRRKLTGQDAVRVVIGGSYTPSPLIPIVGELLPAIAASFSMGGNYSPSNALAPTQATDGAGQGVNVQRFNMLARYNLGDPVRLEINQAKTKKPSGESTYQFTDTFYIPTTTITIGGGGSLVWALNNDGYAPSTKITIPNQIDTLDNGTAGAPDPVVGGVAGSLSITGLLVGSVPDITIGSIAGSLAKMSGTITAQNIRNSGSIQGILAQFTGAVSAEYDVNASRSIIAGANKSRQDEASGMSNGIQSVIQSTDSSTKARTTSLQQRASRTDASIQSRTDGTTAIDRFIDSQREEATPIKSRLIGRSENMALNRIALCGTVDNATNLYDGTTSELIQLDLSRYGTKSVQENTFDSQIVHKRDVYNEVEPLAQYRPSSTVRFDINNDPGFKPEPMIAMPLILRPTYHEEAGMITRAKASGALVMHPTQAGITATLAPTQAAWPIQDSAVVKTNTKTVIRYQVTRHESRPAPTASQINQYENLPAAVYFYYAGKTVLETWAFSYTKGTIHTNRGAKNQQATPKRSCNLIRYEEARKPPPGKSVWIDPPRADPDPNPPTGNTFTVPIQESYIMKNSVLVTLTDLTVIEMDNLKLDFDADSFAWQFGGRLLNHDQLSLVTPLADGTAIKLIVTINAKVFHVLVEKIAHKRRFGQRDISLAGRTLSALLAKPYQQSSTGTQGSLLSVQQIADLHLPFGWTINWMAATWNVPGGAYGYQDRTPIEALADVVIAMGAMIVPSTDSQILNIMPRYPVLPWNFAATSVDVAIPDSAILELTHRQSSQQYANGIYIHGSEIGGELGFCRLNGTAGDVLLPTVSNPIMTDVVGLRAAGERLLASEYTQPNVSSVKTAMDGTTVPFIDVGAFVGITVAGVETKGIVNGVSIEANFPEVTQEITLGEETTNSWVAFKSLLPKDPLLVGTLTSTTGTTSIIQLIDGGVVNVRGTGTVSNKVYIRSGQIQGDAPNLVQNTIVI